MLPLAEIHLTSETLRLLTLFEQVTGASARDVVDEEDRFTFVVDEQFVGRALGKGAGNLKRLRDVLQRDVEMVGYSATAEGFVKNLFHRFKIEKLEIQDRGDGARVARVRVDAADKGKAIGRGGRNVQLARALASRHHNITDVILE